jgi:hypothetical protein
VSRSSPVLVVGGLSFTGLAATKFCSFGVQANGNLWAWGYNNYGELGQNNRTNYSSPVLVIGGMSFVSVATGDQHVLGLCGDGSVWAWGGGFYGELGTNVAAVSYSSPVLVVGGFSFVEIAAGTLCSFARCADGSVWGWGRNNLAQLGNGTLTNYSSPVVVVGGHQFVSLGREDAFGKSWGKQDAYAQHPWTEWANDAVDGQDWGKLGVDAQGRVGPVVDTGNDLSKQFTVSETVSGNVVTYIRGSASAFAVADVSPEWVRYTGPVTQTWRYVQVKVVGA